MKLLTGIAILITGIVASGCSFGAALVGNRSIYEQPTYVVVDEVAKNVEVRRYAARLAAEVTVPVTTREETRDDAFKTLFGYIQGENRSQKEIAMTIPVEVDRATSKEIPMTIPVEVDDSAPDSLTMRFFLPSEYTMENAPIPYDPRVQLVPLPPETVAALEFSGSPSRADITAKEEKLLDSLRASGWTAVEQPRTYYYDAPFTPAPLRRNEVFVRVKESTTGK